jgi:hypothetical protein
MRDPLRVGRVVLMHVVAFVIPGEKGFGRRLLGASKEAFMFCGTNGRHHLRLPEHEV